MPVEPTQYGGWPNNLRLFNDRVEAVVTLDVGPRVIAYRAPGGFNVLKNYPEQVGGTGEAEWQIRGGLRFWLAPEDLTRTYFPDNRPVAHAVGSDTRVTLTPPPETEYGVQKVMTLELDPDSTRLNITLTVTNIGTTATELAPWAPTVMAPGGVEIIPLPAKSPHPGPPSNATSPADYAPNQQLILWPYFDFADPRVTFGSRVILLRQDPTRGPTKFGLAHRAGGAAYSNNGTLFIKRFDYREGATYPDLGTRYQTFTNEDMLEMETCGELVTLAPGESASLSESWELHPEFAAVTDVADAERRVLSLFGG